MRTARTFGVLLAFLLLGFWGGGAVGCNCHAVCEDIAPGTPLASLPQVRGPPEQHLVYCSELSPKTEEVARLWCCSRPPGYFVEDGGFRYCGSAPVDCSQLPPFEVWSVGLPYGGWSCEPLPDFPTYGAPYDCYVWVRDGGVIGTCGGCEPD